jgi:hypothetical protein
MSPEITQALAECRAAFTANQDAKSAWCCHHEKLWELLTEPYEKRIAYILSNKPKYEHLIRFRNFRPCSQHDLIATALKEYEAVRAPALKEYEAVRAPAWKEYEAVRAPAWKEYEAVRATALKEYEAVRATALKEYEAVRAPAWKECEAVTATAYQKDVPLGTWNGKSIFS